MAVSFVGRPHTRTGVVLEHVLGGGILRLCNFDLSIPSIFIIIQYYILNVLQDDSISISVHLPSEEALDLLNDPPHAILIDCSFENWPKIVIFMTA